MVEDIKVFVELDDLTQLRALFEGAVEAWYTECLQMALEDTRALDEIKDDSVFFVGAHLGKVFLGVRSVHDEVSFDTVMYWHALHGWNPLPVE